MHQRVHVSGCIVWRTCLEHLHKPVNREISSKLIGANGNAVANRRGHIHFLKEHITVRIIEHKVDRQMLTLCSTA